MTGFTTRAGFDMATMFSGRGCAVVATRASTRDATVIEGNSLPAQLRGVAGIA